jgi:hypothetical protein
MDIIETSMRFSLWPRKRHKQQVRDYQYKFGEGTLVSQLVQTIIGFNLGLW